MSRRDEVGNPARYNQGGIECIDAIRAALTDEEFRGYCKGNAIKYIWRERMKGGDVSIEEGVWYMERAVSESAQQPPAEHACMIPVSPDVSMDDLPLDVIGVENDGWIAVQCDADGWIDWPGGPMPVRGDARVDVELRDGETMRNRIAAHIGWRVYGDDDDVIRFRAVDEWRKE